jgi:Holliday junction DNA helicase RuvA
MISYVSGELIEKDLDRLVVLVSGIGLEVRAPAGTVDKAGEVGSKISLFTHLHVREDVLQLYGFDSRRARDLFVKLMSVSGFGAVKALGVLSIFTPEEFESAIMMGDSQRLTAIPGVGKKNAERLLLEMKDKFEPSAEEFTGVPADGRTMFKEAAEALVSLDFTRSEAAEMLKKYPFKEGQEPSIEELLQFALKNRG